MNVILPSVATNIGVNITEINGDTDHIHFLLELSPQDNLGAVIGILKCKSSSTLQTLHKFPYWNKHANTVWSKSYFVCTTGGVTIEILKQYIKNQNR